MSNLIAYTIISLFSAFLGAFTVIRFLMVPQDKQRNWFMAYFCFLWIVLSGLYIGTHP